jgi:hypothetical protein
MSDACGNRARLLLAVVAAGALQTGACTWTDVTAVGPRRPALGPDCPVQVFQGPPPYEVTPVATARVTRCEIAQGEQGCISYLRAAACTYGADTIFGVSERLSIVKAEGAALSGTTTTTTTTTTVNVTATLAVRTDGAR